MSRSTVRHATAAYLTAAGLPSVGTIYASPPKISRGGDAYTGVAAGAASGSVLYVEIYDSHEVRDGFGGATSGKKMVTHALRVHVLFRSKARDAQDAMDDHDALLEALLGSLRTDRTLGTAASATPIFQAGEGTAGIKVQSGMPKESGTGETILWTIVDLDALELITS